MFCLSFICSLVLFIEVCFVMCLAGDSNVFMVKFTYVKWNMLKSYLKSYYLLNFTFVINFLYIFLRKIF